MTEVLSRRYLYSRLQYRVFLIDLNNLLDHYTVALLSGVQLRVSYKLGQLRLMPVKVRVQCVNFNTATGSLFP